MTLGHPNIFLFSELASKILQKDPGFICHFFNFVCDFNSLNI